MSKFKSKNFSITNTAGALVGGAGGGAILSVIPVNNTYVKAGILAVGGAALSTFVGGDLVKGLGNGLIAVAGAQIAYELVGGGTPAASGIGQTWQPGANAVGLLPAQRAIGASNWITQRTVTTATNAIPKVTNVM